MEKSAGEDKTENDTQKKKKKWKQIISTRFENRKLVQKINTTPTQTKQAPSFLLISNQALSTGKRNHYYECVLCFHF